MKRLVIIAAIMFAALSARAQFLAGVEFGGSVQYTYQHGKSNVSFDLRGAKRVNQWTRIRAVADIKGTIPNGTDRYGTLVVGATVDFMPAYLFADYGMSINPSASQKVGMAFDCGIGLDVNIKKKWHMFTELAIDRISSGKLWQSSPSVKLGVTYSLMP